MTKRIPSLGYREVIIAPRRDGWVLVRQKGSHIRLMKIDKGKKLNLTIPAHRPIKRTTLAHILKQANMTPEPIIRFAIK